jgi:hypothetical protein
MEEGYKVGNNKAKNNDRTSLKWTHKTIQSKSTLKITDKTLKDK